jgi:hypothetical protein
MREVFKQALRNKFFSWGVLITLLLGFILFRMGVVPIHPALADTSIAINGTGTGRTFNGLGGLSGGGGTSRLLIDYPAQQQSAILDYLFKPNYGANLQILKVEIGGDSDSTEGAEASSQRTPTDQNYNRGYEWWLMAQAKARNPNIKLYGLAWAAPGWLGGGNFWSQDTINYLVNWVQHAQTDHGLHIDYLGGWNERGYYGPWFENLKSALQSKGLTTQVVAADTNWDVATSMKNDATFNSAVDVVGSHYPCGTSSDSSCPSSSDAISLNKPLWASENGSENYDTGAAAMARAYNRDYIDGKITASINWNLVAAFLPNLPYYGDGLMLADQPWSGAYTVGRDIWVTAQTTQFAQPGWQYLDSASGYLGGSNANGSYVTLKSPNNTDYSTIIETMDATSSQIATFQVSGGLSTGTVHVWSTNVNSTNSSNWFVHAQDITPSNGTYSLTLQPGYVYSITTTTGQSKGSATPPARTPFPQTYSDNFESYATGQITKYFSDINGAFESATCGGGRTGVCLRQVITTAPITWMTAPYPLTVIGDNNLSNYQASVDALLEQSGTVELDTNIQGLIGWTNSFWPVVGYHLAVTDGGNWKLYREDWSSDTTLASGTTSFGLNTWHRLSLFTSNGIVSASIDGTALTSVADNTYTSGLVGLEVGGWQNAQFDNFTLNPTSTYYEIVNHNSGQVLDMYQWSTSNGGLADQWPYQSGSNQQWKIVSVNGSYKVINRNSGLLLEDPGWSKTAGVQLDQWGDNNGQNQWWNLVSAGNGCYYLVNYYSGLYADVSGSSTTEGTPVIQQASNSAADQQWQLVAVS